MQILRILLVGFLFSIFGSLCLVGNLVFIPIAVFRLNRFAFFRNLSRDLVYLAWKFFIFCTEFLGYLQYRFEGKEKLGASHSVIIANHPSLLDVVFILSSVRRINCIVKADLGKNIFLFAAIKASGYILNTQNEELLNKAKEVVKNGECLLIFPEGTRTKDKIIFHKAASYIAINAAKNIVPIFIRMHPKSLQKNVKWYKTPPKKIHYNIEVGENIKVDTFYATKPKPIIARLLHDYLSKLYKKEFRE